MRERLRQAVDKNNALEAELEETREKVELSYHTLCIYTVSQFIQGVIFSFLDLYSFNILTAQRA